MRILPAFICWRSVRFFGVVSASWIKAISSAGTPRAISLSRISSYAQKLFWRCPFPLGVARSQKMSCVPLSGVVRCHMSYTFSTTLFSLLSGTSGSAESASRWSSASLRPSLVMDSILSSYGATEPERTASARFPSCCTIAFCSGVGWDSSL